MELQCGKMFYVPQICNKGFHRSGTATSHMFILSYFSIKPQYISVQLCKTTICCYTSIKHVSATFILTSPSTAEL